MVKKMGVDHGGGGEMMEIRVGKARLEQLMRKKMETVGEVKEGRAMKKVEKMMMEITINQLSLVFD